MKTSVEIMQILTAVARPEILKDFREDSCIASTRIGIDVLAHFNVWAEPLCVKAVIYNPAIVKRVEEGHKIPQTIDELNLWQKLYGAHNIGLGFGGDPHPNKFPGHVCILAENKFLIDLSVDQCNRSQHNINLFPFITPVNEEFKKQKEHHRIMLNGCVLCIECDEDNKGYTKSGDWSIAYRTRPAVNRIVKIIEEELNV